MRPLVKSTCIHIFFFIKGLTKAIMNLDDETSVLSSRTLYDFSMNQTENNICQNEICHTNSKFQWHSPYPCDVILVCNVLTGIS